MLGLKFIIILFIIIISSYIGFFKANSFTEREKEIQNILSALNYMKNKIEYTNLYLNEIFNEISLNIFNDKNNMFKETISSNLNIRNSFKVAISNNKKLDIEDKNVLNNLSLSLGSLERNLQISEINIAYNFLLDRLKDAENKKLKNAKMYKVLGACFGLTISIILI